VQECYQSSFTSNHIGTNKHNNTKHHTVLIYQFYFLHAEQMEKFKEYQSEPLFK